MKLRAYFLVIVVLGAAWLLAGNPAASVTASGTVTGIITPPQEIACRRVMMVEDVTNLLKAGVPEARVKNFVTTCKVAFKLTEEQEKKFRGLGASSDIVLAMVLNYQQPPKPEEARVCTKPLEESDVTELLQAGVVDQRLQQLVKTCGVAFQSGPEQAKHFQALGASSDLILAILRNYKPIPDYVLERTLMNHSRGSFSPDGKLMATCCESQYRITLWNVLAGRKLRTLFERKGFSWITAFSPDGKFLASGGGPLDQTIKLWRRVEQ